MLNKGVIMWILAGLMIIGVLLGAIAIDKVRGQRDDARVLLSNLHKDYIELTNNIEELTQNNFELKNTITKEAEKCDARKKDFLISIRLLEKRNAVLAVKLSKKLYKGIKKTVKTTKKPKKTKKSVK